jgi:hypothetical protein
MDSRSSVASGNNRRAKRSTDIKITVDRKRISSHQATSGSTVLGRAIARLSTTPPTTEDAIGRVTARTPTARPDHGRLRHRAPVGGAAERLSSTALGGWVPAVPVAGSERRRGVARAAVGAALFFARSSGSCADDAAALLTTASAGVRSPAPAVRRAAEVALLLGVPPGVFRGPGAARLRATATGADSSGLMAALMARPDDAGARLAEGFGASADGAAAPTGVFAALTFAGEPSALRAGPRAAVPAFLADTVRVEAGGRAFRVVGRGALAAVLRGRGLLRAVAGAAVTSSTPCPPPKVVAGRSAPQARTPPIGTADAGLERPDVARPSSRTDGRR